MPPFLLAGRKMKILGIRKNENYNKIKKACRKKRICLYQLCDKIGITRQNLHNAVYNSRLKNKYIDKIENILRIKLERYYDE